MNTYFYALLRIVIFFSNIYISENDLENHLPAILGGIGTLVAIIIIIAVVAEMKWKNIKKWKAKYEVEKRRQEITMDQL